MILIYSCIKEMFEGVLYQGLYLYVVKITNIENVIPKLLLFAVTEKILIFMHAVYNKLFSYINKVAWKGKMK